MPNKHEEERPDAGSDTNENEKDEGQKSPSHKINRSEKRCRKAVEKLGLTPLEGVLRVTIKKSKNNVYVIDKPDVYRTSAGDSFVIFGDTNVEDPPAAAAQSKAAARFAQQTSARNEDTSAQEVPTGAADAADETDLDEKDIVLVMSQTKCTRAQAVNALKQNQKDIIEAIMQLSAQ